MRIPILFVPGLLCSAEVFAHQAASLWAFGPVMIASTLQGETIEQIASSILRDAPPRFALVGISFGGYVCMEIMRQAPDRVGRLAILDSSARPDTQEQSERRLALLEQARVSDFAPWVEDVLTSIMHPSRHHDAGLRAINRRMGVTVGPQGLERQTQAAMRRPDYRPSLGAIRIPTLVLVGEDDLLIPPERSAEIASLIAASRLVAIPSCGHSSTLERPELVSSALVDWMSG